MDNGLRAARVFDLHAEEYQAKYMRVDAYQASLDAFCLAVGAREATVLELGCGPGNVTQYLLTKRPDFRILGTDLSLRMLELARANNPSATFELLDCRNIRDLRATYDAIVCAFCLPYVSASEMARLVDDAYNALNSGGAMYLSTMEGDPSKSAFTMPSTGRGEPVYMQYYTEEMITDALTHTGFQIEHLSRARTVASDGSASIDILVVAKK